MSELMLYNLQKLRIYSTKLICVMVYKRVFCIDVSLKSYSYKSCKVMCMHATQILPTLINSNSHKSSWDQMTVTRVSPLLLSYQELIICFFVYLFLLMYKLELYLVVIVSTLLVLYALVESAHIIIILQNIYIGGTRILSDDSKESYFVTGYCLK